ncbi:MAG: tRNA (adenosine(37)-N6)-threonylcarbamoyltransferase complex dimerization subunit type 1 TsaB [Planctomycetota bacterium]
MTRDDLILAIETSNPSAPMPASALTGPGVCLLGHTGVRAHAPLEPVDRHDDALLPAIDRACAAAGAGGAARADLTRVGVSVGPGGYTSVRIAVSVAKSIAEALGIGCVGVPTAHALVRASAIDGRSLVALAWKRDDVWVQAFDGGREESPGRVVGLDDLPAVSDGRTLIAEHRLRERIDHVGAWADPVFSAEAVALLAREADAVDPSALLPLYPREPEAVRKWRAIRR